MNPRPFLALLLVGCAHQPPVEEPTSAPEPGAEASEGYVIQLQRRHEVGDRARWEERIEEVKTQRMTVGGQVVQEQASEVDGEVRATVEVREVDDEGRVVRADFTIELMRVDRDGEVTQLEPGSVVTVTRSATGGGFAIGGAPVDEATDELIDLFFSKKSGGDVSSVFGSTTPRQPGSSWPLDVDRFLVEFAGQGIPVELARESVRGGAQFVAVEDLDGTEVLHLILGAEGQISSVRGMPGEVTGGSLTMSVDGLWPADGVSPQRGQTATITMEMDVSGEDPQAGPFTMHIGFGKKGTRSVTPL